MMSAMAPVSAILVLQLAHPPDCYLLLWHGYQLACPPTFQQNGGVQLSTACAA